MIRLEKVGFLVFAVVFLMACGGSSDSSTDSAAPGSPVEDATSGVSSDGSGTEVSLDTLCPEFCAVLLKCRQDAAQEIDGDFMDSCETGCEEWNSASQTQSCMDAHLTNCDLEGFSACQGL